MPPRRLIVIAVAAIAVAGVGTAVAFQFTDDGPDDRSGPRVVQPGAPGQPGRTLSDADISKLASAPPHTPADTLFMQHMIMHHGQALEMTALVAGHSTNKDIALFAERITLTQRDEIALMQKWLRERRESTDGGHAGHASMPGMLTADQLSQLDRARGAEFDRLFLEYMIMHHQGALRMVEELYTSGGGLEPECDRFAREVTADQGIEINRMQAMLTAMR